MLKFLVFEDGQSPQPWQLTNAHLLGADGIGVRGQIDLQGNLIVCEKRAMGAAALAVQVAVGELGEFTLQTCLLPDREEPYLLSLELARHRLMLLLTKQEDWLMFELPADHPSVRRANLARQLFVKALNSTDDPAAADKLARESLIAAIDASEELALAHAEVLLNRRKVTGQLARGVFGCGVGLKLSSSEVRASLLANFDYLSMPTRWRQIEPQEQQFDWQGLDGWADWAFRNRLPILAGPVVSFDQSVMPDWLYIVEHDYETLRDLLYEHAERLVTRYRNVVTMWNVVSGIHVNAHFTLNLEQLMDLTRMAVMLTKKIQPTAKALIEITQPFGEYYATNQRSIPPLMYADMVLQSGIPIDAFGLKLVMGQPVDGRHTRDLMQISSLLDRFSGLGKPVHVTAVAVPSEPGGGEGNGADAVANGNGNGNGAKATEDDADLHGVEELAEMDDAAAAIGALRDGQIASPCSGGCWRKPWSQQVQSHWLQAFYNIALSKPFIESVAWLDLADHEHSDLPYSGLAAANLKTKQAFHRIAALRKPPAPQKRKRRTRAMIGADDAAKRGRRTNSSRQLGMESIHD